ncbi:MAG TPA: hypothetical protein VM141_03925 [Planctomycetota bacterium]|nr:hypothetical protein [Planctomycetota bacterium]
MANIPNGDYVVEQSPQPVQSDALQTILSGAPWWLGSLVFHAFILLVFAQIGWEVGTKTDRIAATDIRPPVEEEEDVEEEPEKPEFEEASIIDPTLPPSDTIDTPEQEIDQPDMDVPGFNTLEPDEAPPLAIAKLALGEDGAPGHFHGIYGNRGGSGRKKSILRRGGSPLAEASVNEALGWLARVQEADGHWDSKKWGGGGQDVGVSGLATLAFLGHGETDRDGKYRATVAKALEYLERKCASNGSFGEQFYTQGICTMAMSEAYGMTRNPRWGAVAQRALDYCVANQNPNGGWDYHGNNPARVDTSVTAWVVMGVKSGVASNLRVPEQALERIKKWLYESVNPDGSTGYTKNIGAQGSGGGMSVSGLTAAASLCRQFMGWKPDAEDLAKSLNYVDRAGVNLKNVYQVYYGTLCMFQAGGEYWSKWNKQFRDPLIALQVKNRGPELDGSWDHLDDTLGGHGGRVYTTAMAVFCLEVYYRFLPVLK